MKKFLLGILILSCFLLHAQTPAGSPQLKKGLHLVYDVEQGEKNYQYIVDFTAVTDSSVSFTWKMTDPVNTSGTITIKPTAWKTARRLDFYPSTREYNDYEISMIFSKKMFEKVAAFHEGDTVAFGCNACFREVVATSVEKGTYEAQNQDGNLTNLNVLKFSSIYHNGDFEILQDEKFPLIVYFKWNMLIALSSFSYN